MAVKELDNEIPIKAGTRVTVLTLVPNTQGRIRFSVGSNSLEMPAKLFVKITKERD